MGLFKKSKSKASDMPTILTCKHGDHGSYNCIFLASYRDLPVEIEWIDSSELDEKITKSLHLSNLKQYPCIKDGEFTICGETAVLTYLNIKGRAPTIHPRKARVLALQQYWIQVLETKFIPLIHSDNKNEITEVLKSLDSELKDKKYIVGEISLADFHWASIFKVLEEEGKEELYNSFNSVMNWLNNIKTEIPNYEFSSEKVAA